MAGIKTMRFKVGAGAAKKEGGSQGYAGKIPPTGSYRVKLKRLTVVINGKGDPMLKGLAEINEPKGSDDSKFNGYGIWFQQNITDQGAGYVNQVLNALAESKGFDATEIKEAFWGDGVKVKPDEKKGEDVMHVKKIGDMTVNSPEADIEFIISGKFKPSKQYGDKLEAMSYAPLLDGEATSSDDEDAYDEDDEEEVVMTKAAPKEEKKKKAKKAKLEAVPDPEPEDDDEDEAESDDDDDDDDDDEPAF